MSKSFMSTLLKVGGTVGLYRLNMSDSGVGILRVEVEGGPEWVGGWVRR